MTQKKQLKKIKKRLEEMRKSPYGITAEELISLAKKLGRTRDNRGKEPTYIRESDPILTPPLSIPAHPGDLKVGTAKSIINSLLDDADDWEIHLQELEEGENHDDDDDN